MLLVGVAGWKWRVIAVKFIKHRSQFSVAGFFQLVRSDGTGEDELDLWLVRERRQRPRT